MSQATITGKVGPGNTMAATVISNVVSFTLDTVNEVLTVSTTDRSEPFRIDVAADTTITITVSGNNYTISFS